MVTDPHLFEQYALSLVWRSFASGDPLEDLGSAVQTFMALNGFKQPKEAVLGQRLQRLLKHGDSAAPA